MTDQHAAKIFEAALKLPPRERAVYLDQACAGDIHLRQRIVEALFKAQESTAVKAHDPSTPNLQKTVAAPFPAEVPGEKPGDRIGRYKLLDKIGEGGMGSVWVAEQTEPVRREVALKIIMLGMDTKQVVARFEAERQALALMDHPNITRVLDAGATETGRPYFVMELVKGIPITEYCDKNNLATTERLGLFVQVCQAIQHAHQKGIIHRDIKPSNTLVCLHDGVPVPKIIDFGIAKATAGQRLTDKTLHTALAEFIGTPAYVSPEQAEMAAVDIDTRSDIYSLGVMLYELLTGRTPFDAKRLVEAGLDGIRRIIREEDPPRPSTRISTLNAKEQTIVAKRRKSEPPKLIHLVRGDLDWIVMKTLEKDRTRRYETANGLADDIQRHLNNEPVVAAAPSAIYKFSKFARRHRVALAAVSGTTLALMFALCFSTWMFFRERAARSAADEQTAITQAVSDFLTHNLLGSSSGTIPFASDLEPIHGQSPLDDLKRAAASIGDKFNDKPVLEAKLRQAIGDAYCASAVNQPTLALAHYQRAVDLLKRTLGSDHADTLSGMKRLARALADSGRFPEAVSLNKEVVKLLEAKFGPDHDETLWFMLYLGFTYERGDQDAEAIALYEKMMRLTKARAAGVGDGATWMGLRSRLSDAYERRKEFDKAEAIIREFVAISEQKEGKTSTLAAAGLRALGNCLLKQQKYAEAEQELRKSFAIQDEAYPDSWIPFNTRSMLGAAILGQKRFSEAEPLLLTAYAGIKKREDQPPIDTDPVGRTIERLVELYTAWGKPAEAAQWKQALEAHQVAASQRKAAAK